MVAEGQPMISWPLVLWRNTMEGAASDRCCSLVLGNKSIERTRTGPVMRKPQELIPVTHLFQLRATFRSSQTFPRQFCQFGAQPQPYVSWVETFYVQTLTPCLQTHSMQPLGIAKNRPLSSLKLRCIKRCTQIHRARQIRVGRTLLTTSPENWRKGPS